MNALRAAAAGLLLLLVVDAAIADDAKAMKTTVYRDYFEKNSSGLTGPESFVVIGDRKKFDATFGLAVVMGRKPEVLSADAFDAHLVVAAIHRGKSVWTYHVDSAAVHDGVLKLRYRAEAKEGGGSATFASPLIVEVPKGDYKSVEFIENGKAAATVSVR